MGGDVGDEDTGRGGRDAGHVVVFGVPDAVVAGAFCGLCGGDGGGEGVADVLAGGGDGEVEHRVNSHIVV